MDPSLQQKRRERAQPLFIMAALMVAYAALASPNLTRDGAASIAWFHEHGMMRPLHPLWGYFLSLCLNAGRAAGLTLMQAGQMQSALTAAAAGGMYFAWLRRLGVGMRTATLFAMIFGLSGTVLEIATTVDLYGVALLAVVLSLHAWLSEIKEPSPGGAAELWGACALVVGLHAAWAPWVLVIYVVLAWNERRRRARAAGRIIEGAAVGIAIGAWLAWGGYDIARQGHFFSMLFEGGAASELIARPFATLFTGPVLNGGLLAVLAIPGVMVMRKNTPVMYRFILLATVLFFVCFGFAPPDRGECFLPVLALWGFAGALVVDRLSPDRRRTIALMMVMFALTLAMYLPAAVKALQPDAVTLKLNVFKEIAPPGARLVTEIPPYRPFAQTGHESISLGDAPGAVDEKQAQATLAQWIQELQAGGPSVWFDEKMWGERKKLLGPVNWDGLSIQRAARKDGAFYGLVKE
ncbi:MAG: hypothetical protein ABFD69_04100 [Candidatus Sumerlaeia bacterium]